MRAVRTTVFFTRAWTSWADEPWHGRALLLWHRWWLLALGFLLTLSSLQLRAADIQHMALARTDEGLFLSSAVSLELGSAVEDALLRSVPVYFVAQTEVLRERWYWTDKRVANATRTYRLAYQPLTRRWRVSVSSGVGPGSALQYALHQNHDSLAQAMATITRISGWQVAEAARLEPGGGHRLEFRFKLDMALLPRPFQLDMNAQTDWNLDLRRTLAVPSQVTSDRVPAADPDVAGETRAGSAGGVKVP